MSHACVTQDLFHAHTPVATLDLLLDAWGTPVLLISSSAPVGRQLQTQLAGPGEDVFHVTRAAGWHLALEALQAQDFAAIIVDTQRLDIDPQQALALLRRVARATPVFNLVSDPEQGRMPHPLTLPGINRRTLLQQIRRRQRTAGQRSGAADCAPELGATDRTILQRVDEIRRGVQPTGLDISLEPLRAPDSPQVIGWHTRVDLSTRSGRGLHAHELLARAHGCGADVGLLWQWILQRGCRLLEEAGPGILVVPMSLNLGSHDAVLRTLGHTLARRGLEASQVRLQCTESEVMAQPELAAVWASELRLLGLGLGLSQVGRADSSLPLLARLQPTVMEIDQELSGAVHTCPDSHRALAAAVALAHSLNAKVGVVNVQCELQRSALADLGCDWVRG